MLRTAVRRAPSASLYGEHPAPRRKLSDPQALAILDLPSAAALANSAAVAASLPAGSSVRSTAAAPVQDPAAALRAELEAMRAAQSAPSLARGARARALAATAASASRTAHPRLPPPRRRRQAGASAPASAEDEEPSALLQELAKWSASSDNLMADMRKTFGSRFDRSEVLLQLSTRYLLVGKCDSRFAGVARFLPTKVIYSFEHPQHRHVEMHMSYADMVGVRTQPATLHRRSGVAAGGTASSGSGAGAGELRFRINGPLAYFARDYDPADAGHDLRIGFESEADVERFKKIAWAHVSALAKAEEDGVASVGEAPGETEQVSSSSRTAVRPRVKSR